MPSLKRSRTLGFPRDHGETVVRQGIVDGISITTGDLRLAADCIAFVREQNREAVAHVEPRDDRLIALAARIEEASG